MKCLCNHTDEYGFRWTVPRRIMASMQVRDRLDVVFPQRWLGPGGPVPWLARSPDLTPLDFFLWGHVKHMVYVTPVPSLEDLKYRITTACTSITAEMLADVRQTLIKRI